MIAKTINWLKIAVVIFIWLIGVFPQELLPTVLLLNIKTRLFLSFFLSFTVVSSLYLIQYSLIVSLFRQNTLHSWLNWLNQRSQQVSIPFYLKGVLVIKRLVDNFATMLTSSPAWRKLSMVTLFGFLPLGLTFFALINLARLHYFAGLLALLAGVAVNIFTATIIGYLGINYTAGFLWTASVIAVILLYNYQRNHKKTLNTNEA